MFLLSYSITLTHLILLLETHSSRNRSLSPCFWLLLDTLKTLRDRFIVIIIVIQIILLLCYFLNIHFISSIVRLRLVRMEKSTITDQVCSECDIWSTCLMLLFTRTATRYRLVGVLFGLVATHWTRLKVWGGAAWTRVRLTATPLPIDSGLQWLCLVQRLMIYLALITICH